jgi:hypothetical protein
MSSAFVLPLRWISVPVGVRPRGCGFARRPRGADARGLRAERVRFPLERGIVTDRHAVDVSRGRHAMELLLRHVPRLVRQAVRLPGSEVNVATASVRVGVERRRLGGIVEHAHVGHVHAGQRLHAVA